MTYFVFTLLFLACVQSIPIQKVKEVQFHEKLVLPGLSNLLKRNQLNQTSSIIPLSFTAHDRNFNLELEPHTAFIAPDATFQIESNGKLHDIEFDKNAYYTGRAKMGDDVGFVSLRINHKQGYMSGIIFGEKESFGIEHASSFYEGPTEFPMVIYKSSDIVENTTCGVKGTTETHSILAEVKNMKRQSNTCRITLVGDFRLYNQFSQDAIFTMERLMDMMAGTEVMYRNQNVGGFQVANVLLYTTQATDPLYASATAFDSYLNRLTQIKSSIPPTNKCLVHAVTYYTWSGGTVGYASVGVTCQTNGGAGTTTHRSFDRLSSLWSVTNTMAHEIGHNYGANHDGSGNYIMAASGGSNTIRQFSTQSLNSFQQSLAVAARSSCLVAPPPTVGFCGNGYLDSGEECDCGSNCASSAFCDANCNLKGSYQCNPANGKCCSAAGTLLTAGTVCETAPYPGIPAPTCTGTSPVCPDCFPDSALHPCDSFSNTFACNYQPCKVGCSLTQGGTCYAGTQFNPPLPANLPDGTCCTGGVCQNGVCVPVPTPTSSTTRTPSGTSSTTRTPSGTSSTTRTPSTTSATTRAPSQTQQTTLPSSQITSQITAQTDGDNNNVNDGDSASDDSNVGLIAGAVVAVIVVVIIVAVVCAVGFVFCRKKST